MASNGRGSLDKKARPGSGEMDEKKNLVITTILSQNV